MPRVGGVSQTGGAREAWTGGSNITPPTMPWNVYCRRPLDFRSAAQVQTACTKGLDNDEKLGAIDEHKNMVQLTAWIESLQYHMRNLGMDTVFKVITDLETAESETDVLVHWSRILSLDIKGWIQALTVQGVPSKDSPLRSPVCPYDLQNLEWSGNFIMNSISQKLRTDVATMVGKYPHGPVALREIINIKQQLDAAGVRTLEDQLKGFCISKEPAENVINYITKIKPVYLKLANCVDKHGSPHTRDLSTLIAKGFIKCSVETFRLRAMHFYNICNEDPTRLSWDEITSPLLLLYRSLSGQVGGWPPAEAKKRVTEQLYVNELQQTINQLTSKISDLNKTKSGTDNKVICYDCGKPGVKIGHDGCTQPGRRLHAPKKDKDKKPPAKDSDSKPKFPPLPKDNDPHEITWEGKKWKFCQKCRKGKGSWWETSSSKAHLTAEHKTGGTMSPYIAMAPPPPVTPAAPPAATITFAADVKPPAGPPPASMPPVPAAADVSGRLRLFSAVDQPQPSTFTEPFPTNAVELEDAMYTLSSEGDGFGMNLYCQPVKGMAGYPPASGMLNSS